MALITPINPTLIDLAKSLDPNGKIAAVAEILNQTNEITRDGVFVEANNMTSHRITQRTGLPPVYWRMLNQGIPPSTSTKAQVDETIGLLTSRVEIDRKEATMSGNVNAYRESEVAAHVEALGQEWASTTFYGNHALNPEKFAGLSPRYSDPSAGNGQNIIDGGGDNAAAVHTSIWLIGWSPQTCYYIYPRGSSLGIQHEDLGQETIQQQDDSVAAQVTGQPLRRLLALVDYLELDIGLALKDWRYVVRIGNIEAAELAALGDAQVHSAITNILHSMAKAVARIPTWGGIRPAFYMNRTAFSALQRIGMEKSAAVLRINDAVTQHGMNVDGMGNFMGVPVRLTDALLNTEEKLTFS